MSSDCDGQKDGQISLKWSNKWSFSGAYELVSGLLRKVCLNWIPNRYKLYIQIGTQPIIKAN